MLIFILVRLPLCFFHAGKSQNESVFLALILQLRNLQLNPSGPQKVFFSSVYLVEEVNKFDMLLSDCHVNKI